MSHDVPCCTALSKLVQTSQLSSPDGTLAPLSTGCTSSPPAPRATPTVVLTKGCSAPTCGLSAATDPVLQFVLADLCRLLDDGAKLFAHLDGWYLYIKLHCLNDALVLISATVRSVNLCTPILQNPSVQGILPGPHLPRVARQGQTDAQLPRRTSSNSGETASPVLWSLVNKPQWRKPRDDSVTLLPPLPSSMLPLPYTKISANSGVDQGCPLSTCPFSAAIDPVLRFVLADI